MKYLSVLLLLILLSCSGILGQKDGLNIVIPQMASNNRYISPEAIEGYVVVMKGDAVYSANNFTDAGFNYLVNGQVFIANLPIDNYVIGIVLLNENDMVGFALKEVTVKQGYNEVSIEVGPGIEFLDIDGLDFSNPFDMPEGTHISFAQDTMIIDYSAPTESISLSMTFGSDDGDIELSGPEITDLGNGLQFYYTSNVPSEYTFRIILE